MSELELKDLVGLEIVSAEINEDKDIVVLKTKDKSIYLSWVGGCCSKCFLAHLSGAENMTCSTILEAESSEWKDVKRDEENYKVVESMGTKIKTNKGYVDMETRLEHNGYYGGEITISTEKALDQYSDLIDLSEHSFTPLKDF